MRDTNSGLETTSTEANMTEALSRYICGITFIYYVAVTVFRGHVILGNFSDYSFDPMFRTPFIYMLNASEAESLREQTDNISSIVSNTSLADLYSDNDTQQLQIRYRERKRKERLILIQRDILQKLGLKRKPNISSRLTDEERQRMLQLFDSTHHTEQTTTNNNTPDSTEL